MARYKGIYFRGDAGFANPSCYEYLEAEATKYAIRLPKNNVLQEKIGYLLTRPVGRPPNHVWRPYAKFRYQAASWTKPRRVIAKVEWHPSKLVQRVGFVFTNMACVAENVVGFYNMRGTCEQWIKEGRARSSGRDFHAGRFRPTLFAFSFTRSPTISAILCAR